MMFHTSSANESFTYWSTCGTALHHLIVLPHEQELLDQVEEWKEVLEVEPNNSENNKLPFQSPQKTCIFNPVSKTRDKKEELLQKSENISLSKHKISENELSSDKRKLFANRKFPSRRYSVEDIEKPCEVSKLQRSASLSDVFGIGNNAFEMRNSTQELFNTLSENSKLHLLPNKHTVKTAKTSTSMDYSNMEAIKGSLFSSIPEELQVPLQVNSYAASTNDTSQKKSAKAVAVEKIEIAGSLTKKLPFKKSSQQSHVTGKTSKMDDKRILSNIKNIKEKDTTKKGLDNDSDKTELPNKKQKTSKFIQNPIKEVHSGNITTAKVSDEVETSENQHEKCLSVNGSTDSTESFTLSSFKTPHDIHILNNIQLSEKDSQDVQETVQNLSDAVCHNVEVPDKTNSNFSQEVFKDLDISSSNSDIPNSNSDCIPNSNDIPGTNLDLNTSHFFLSKGSLPYSQIPLDFVSHDNEGPVFSENMPPRLTLEVTVENPPLLIPQLLKEANPRAFSQENMSSRLPVSNAPYTLNDELIVPTILLKDKENQSSTPVEEGILPMKITQENMFSLHPEDFMNISSSSSIPCGQAPKPLTYVPSLPSSQESDNGKVINPTYSVLENTKMGDFMLSQPLSQILDKDISAVNEARLILPGGSKQNISVHSPLKSGGMLFINDNNQQTNSELTSKILAARKKLVFHEKEDNLGKHLKVPSNERKRKRSKDPKSYPYKKAKLIPIEFTQSEISSMIDTMKDLFS